MNPISDFLVNHIVEVYFAYGLAFFTLGTALAVTSRRASELSFARALRPLAAFGIVHGVHEWLEMFQRINGPSGGSSPPVGEEWFRLAILVASFVLLGLSGLMFLRSATADVGRSWVLMGTLLVLWSVGVTVIAIVRSPTASQLVEQADVLARYLVAIPSAILCALGLMRQQHLFRQREMPKFGRDLLWCSAAMWLYGVLGQLFVRQTSLPPSTIINSTLFLDWFGVPVQLFRAAMATIIAVFMVRALNAFEHESLLRTEQLNTGLRATARELALLLELSNLLAGSMELQPRLDMLLDRLVSSLSFPDNGMILLAHGGDGELQVRSMIGLQQSEPADSTTPEYQHMVELAGRSMRTGKVACRHADGAIFEFAPTGDLARIECRGHTSPPAIIAFPLAATDLVIGSVVLGREDTSTCLPIQEDEFRLMVGSVQQLGLSIQNTRLVEEAKEREQSLADLLRQSVGAQESERQRIARELHDVTAQSVSAVALGLAGLRVRMEEMDSDLRYAVQELQTIGTNALGELRNIIADLRPPQLDDLGLVSALKWYVGEFESRHQIACDLTTVKTRSRLPAEAEIVLFRIAQEALTNVARHSNASRVGVTLRVEQMRATLAVVDDGVGFDSDAVLADRGHPGWGLLGIQERASLLGGSLQLDTSPGRGTLVKVTVPISQGDEHVEG